MRRAAAAAGRGARCQLGGLGCGEDWAAGRTLTVYVCVPLGGVGRGGGRSPRRRLARGRRRRAGDFRVRAVYIDDSGGGPRWNPVAAAASGTARAEDSTAIGFIGDLDSARPGSRCRSPTRPRSCRSPRARSPPT